MSDITSGNFKGSGPLSVWGTGDGFLESQTPIGTDVIIKVEPLGSRIAIKPSEKAL
jgi:hypothetical protein